MSNDWVTVITPTFNSRKTVFSAIDSVLTQKYPYIEYLIIDDGSDDFEREPIVEYIEEHKSAALKYSVLENKVNLGTVKTLNRAIMEARGRLIFNLAADDCFCDDDVVGDWTEFFEVSGADIVTAKRAAVDRDEKILFSQPDDNQTKVLETGNNSLILEALAPVNFIYGSNTARTRESFEKFGLYDEKYRLIEDYSSALQLLRKGAEFRLFDRVAVRYRPGGISEAGKLNRFYLRENKAIFLNEALPFVKDKRNAKRLYAKWLRKVKYNARAVRFHEELKRCGGSKTRCFFLKTGFYLRNAPIAGAKNFIKKMSCRGEKCE